ncbi:Structural protein [Dissostichus eleginoides]|uniref:Structural protein n=1 Tax=Dissostichus eleginoides TaxID=100907 RepID=A0AAD9EV09_DISEL|nr:Structural protein [Dissostichus eleginoides]
MENCKQLEDEQTIVDMKTKMEIIERQRQLTLEVMGKIEQLWEEAQRERNETDYLEKKAEQQQEDIVRLRTENQKQHLLINRLRSQIEKHFEKLEENKNEAAQEKLLLLKMRTEIYREKETLEKRRYELINERHELEMIKVDKTTQKSIDPKEAMEQIERKQEITDSLLSLINKNNKVMLETKQEKEHMEKIITDIKQELIIIQNNNSHHRDQLEHIKHNIHLKMNTMKRRWADIQRAERVELQEATVPEMKGRERQKEGRHTFGIVKIHLCRFQKEMKKLWDELEVTLTEEQELKTVSSQMANITCDSQKQREDTDVNIKIKQWQTDMEADMQRQQQNIEEKLAWAKSEKDDIDQIKINIQTEREDIERERQIARAEMIALTCVRESTERQMQELDDKLLRTKKEIREKEELNTEIEIKKKELVKMIRMSKRKNKEFSSMMEEAEPAKQDMQEGQDKTKEQVNVEDTSDEQKKQLPLADRTTDITQEVNTEMKRVILEGEEIRKMLCGVREDTERSRTDFTEERKIQWMNFQLKKKQRQLDQQLEKTNKERDELDVTKIKIQKLREEVEQKLKDTITAFLNMDEIKASIEKATTEMKKTREEMLKVQREMDQNKEHINKFRVSQ